MILFEVCCGGYEDALAAEAGGADRIELNSALSLGGLTPDIGSLALCQEHLDIPVVAMLRPRAGGFCYTDKEYAVMEKSAEYMLREGADGLAFGFLTEDRRVDEARTGAITELVHAHGGEAVFHRAFDCVQDFSEAAEQLIALGVDRILTSGGAGTALDGASCLRQLQEEYGDRIEILAGSGVRPANVGELLAKTKVSQVHSSCRGYLRDATARGNQVSFSYEGAPEWDCYEVVSVAAVEEFRHKLNG